MLKFKNKFKFSSEKDKDKDKDSRSSASLSPTLSTTSTSTNNNAISFNEESRKTISLKPSNSSISTATGHINDSSIPSFNDINANLQNLSLNASDEGTPETNGTDSTSESTSSSSKATPTSGYLSVKLYSGEDISLPIKITNNQLILKKLIVNGKDLGSVPKMLADVAKLTDSELEGVAATSVLPAAISIPNNNNIEKSLIYLTIEFDNNVTIIEPVNGNFSNPNWSNVTTFDASRNSSLSINIFGRLPNLLIPQEEKSNKSKIFLNNNNDFLIGSLSLPINLNSLTTSRLYNHEKFGFKNSFDINAGYINITVDFKASSSTAALSIQDFDLLKVIGKGSFGKVMQVCKKDTKKVYALKTIRKAHIVSRMEVVHTLAERTVLARVSNPFIVPLKFSFQSREKLYLVLTFINGGELFHHLQREGKFSLSRSRFYIAELLTALECLHDLNVIYRDLKPENILLDYQGHIALCDFGLCKLNMKITEKTNTFCGTPEYLAPELLLNKGYTRVVDWWTLGVLLYEMLTGLPPYYDEDVPKMYKKILQEPLRFPSFIDADSKDLLIGLLNRDPKKRLGINGAQEIKDHVFFNNVDWKRLLMKGYTPPFKPPVDGQFDTSNFDSEFTSELPKDSVVDDFLSESVQKQFGGWTYTGGSGIQLEE